MIALGVPTPPDNTNLARLMEFQRLLAPVSVAEWLVLTTQSDQPIITNDIGNAPFANPWVGHRGMAIPLDHSHILVIVPQPRNILSVAAGGQWYPDIQYTISPGENHVDLNHVLAARAPRFIFGPGSSTVASYLTSQSSVPPLEPEQMGFITGYPAMMHDLAWRRLITVLARSPQTDGQKIYLDLLHVY